MLHTKNYCCCFCLLIGQWLIQILSVFNLRFFILQLYSYNMDTYVWYAVQTFLSGKVKFKGITL